ncbi:hypothetical protein BASA81_012723 [Batrachochytrium salamandrivorans]|nr:hypothetical protein BASA81_012723 [Batrachochytrium salamandrivorans]
MVRRDQSIPCGAMMAEGFFRGAILGTIWGSVADLELMESAISGKDIIGSSDGKSWLRRRAAVIGHSARGFSVFFAAYSLGSCVGEDLFVQPRNSPVSGFCGGFLGGFALSALSLPVNLRFCFTTGFATGTIAGSAILLQQALAGNVHKYF